MQNVPLHLASASPRRRDILRGLGLHFSYGGENLDESRHAGEAAADLVVRLALDKATAAAARRPATAVLGADTEVVLDERIFGKPASRDEALDMLSCLSGRRHDVMTGIAVVIGERRLTACSVSTVLFRTISPAEADAYWRTGEPHGKAGGYAIQGLAGIFAREISGSYSGIVGLPVYECAQLLCEAGIDVLARGFPSGD
ncbi:MAG: Maf family protein [Woeseia sp.]